MIENLVGMGALLLLVVLVSIIGIIEQETQTYEVDIYDEEQQQWVSGNYEFKERSIDRAYDVAHSIMPEGTVIIVKEKEKD